LTEAERAWGVAPVPSPSVTYQPDVVMVGGGPAAVRGMSPDGLTWTLDGGAERAGEIVPGKIVFVTGRVVGRVLGVTRQSGTVAVVLGPVELTDVIKEAAISVRQPVDFSKALVYTQNDPVGASTPVDPIAQATEPGPAGARPVLASYPARDGPWPPDGAIVSSPVVVYGEPQGGYVRTQSGQPVTVRKFTVYPVMGSDGIGLHMSSDADGIRLTGDVRLRLAQPTLNFDLDIKGGKIRKALVRLDGAAGLLLKFEAGSEKGFSANVNERIVVPVDFSLPITGLSVPFAVTVRQQFIIKTAFSGTTGLKATGDYSFGGSFSAGYQNGKFEIGGPTGVGTVGDLGSTVFSYGNSELRLGITKLSPKQGTVIQSEGNGWSHIVITLTPGVPGDSGSGFMNESGQAFGVLSTLQIAPLAGTNGVGDLGKELAYARAHGFPGLQLVTGTEPFKPDLVGAVLGA